MRIYRSLSDVRLTRRPRSIAIGIFDGVHLGHQRILKRAKAAAQKKMARFCVVTFDPHPEKVLRRDGTAPKILMSLEHRVRTLKDFGADEVLIIPFDKAMARISHDDFLCKVLIGRLGMVALSVGEDFRFGQKAAGDTSYLSRRSREMGFSFAACRHLMYQGKAISSTRIRQAIEKGMLKSASKMLGRPVSVSGDVVRGQGRGKTLGFPTANLDPHHETLPPPGVYAVYGLLGRSRLRGVVHIGVRPTFSETEPSLEVHFLGIDRNLYGQSVELIFVHKLRGIRRFGSPKELVQAIQKDIRQAQKHLRAS